MGEGFGDQRGTGIEPPLNDRASGVSSGEQHSQKGPPPAGFLGKLNPVQLSRKPRIDEQERDVRLGLQHPEGGCALRRLQNPIAELAKRLDDMPAYVTVVLDDKDRFKTARGRRILRHHRPPASRVGDLGGETREIQLDGGAFPQLAVDSDPTVALLSKSIDLRQSEAGSLAGGFGREKRLERLLITLSACRRRYRSRQ